MNWYELYPKTKQPELKEIDDFIANPLWTKLKEHLEESYKSTPNIGYSSCSAEPGWNVKYKKSSKALCTVYPREGGFICMVSVGPAQEEQAKILMPTFSEHIRTLYADSKPSSMGRWLMINVSDEKILDDVKTLIKLRTMKKSS